MIIVAIPARLASSRLPGKMLLNDTGKPLLCHTIEQAMQSKLANLVFILTPDDEIVETVKSMQYGDMVQTIKTGDAKSGTERIAKFCGTYMLDDEHIVVNFQGDEPRLAGRYVDVVARIVELDLADVATLASPTDTPDDMNMVKVVCDNLNRALWFSRYPIPMGGPWLRHVGLYAYKVKFLKKILSMPDNMANGESLEQLQWLQNGCKIHVSVDDVNSFGVDTLSDYQQFIASNLVTTFNGEQV